MMTLLMRMYCGSAATYWWKISGIAGLTMESDNICSCSVSSLQQKNNVYQLHLNCTEAHKHSLKYTQNTHCQFYIAFICTSVIPFFIFLVHLRSHSPWPLSQQNVVVCVAVHQWLGRCECIRKRKFIWIMLAVLCHHVVVFSGTCRFRLHIVQLPLHVTRHHSARRQFRIESKSHWTGFGKLYCSSNRYKLASVSTMQTCCKVWHDGDEKNRFIPPQITSNEHGVFVVFEPKWFSDNECAKKMS